MYDDIWHNSTALPLTTSRYTELNSLYFPKYIFIDIKHRNWNHSLTHDEVIIIILEFVQLNSYRINQSL